MENNPLEKTGRRGPGAAAFTAAALIAALVLGASLLYRQARAEREVRQAAGQAKDGEAPLGQTKGASALRVPPGFRAREGTIAEPYSRTGWANEVIHEKTLIEMVFVPAGDFKMGADEFPDERPAHWVKITRPFYMGKYEVTQDQWQRIMPDNPSHFKGKQNPVDTVSWNDCREFLAKTAGGLSLPTEAEWEYACRAGTKTRFSFGDDENKMADYGWCTINSKNSPHVVGQKKPNAWGLYDMHGNLWEWCLDRYPSGYGSNTPIEDPQGPSAPLGRILRGGCWFNNAIDCRSSFRFGNGPGHHDFGLCGFRVVRRLGKFAL